jgi:hypothetical protein
MNDLRETIERITAGLEPASGCDALSTRRNRSRTRRRFMAGALALMVATGGSLLAVRALPRRTPATSSQAIVVATWPTASATTSGGSIVTARTDCPTPSGDDRAWALSSTSGAAGSSVEVSGTFWEGVYWVQLWWNADGEAVADAVGPPPWPPTGPRLEVPPAGPGPVVEVVSVAGPASGGDCAYRASFIVPDVDRGTYQLVFVMGALTEPQGEGGGYAVLQSASGSVTFDVSG